MWGRVRFSNLAWGILIYNLAVILWGAIVRATGSGAGCGSHWPLCNGVVVPLAPAVGTVIEFVHRLMSGSSLLLIAALVVGAWRTFPKGDRVRKGAAASGVLIITEALIGAGLVLFGWVAKDVSVARTVSISLHLINTFLLLASLSLTAWWAGGGPAIRIDSTTRWPAVLGIGLLGVTVIGMSGAITALGDTLFPAGSLAAGIAEDASPTASFLVRLRVVHPLIAIAVGAYLLTLLSFTPPANPRAVRLAFWLRGAVFLQLAAGALNVVLLAPIWMQIMHLLIADVVWILLVLFSASVLSAPEGAKSKSGAAEAEPLAAPAGPGL